MRSKGRLQDHQQRARRAGTDHVIQKRILPCMFLNTVGHAERSGRQAQWLPLVAVQAMGCQPQSSSAEAAAATWHIGKPLRQTPLTAHKPRFHHQHHCSSYSRYVLVRHGPGRQESAVSLRHTLQAHDYKKTGARITSKFTTAPACGACCCVKAQGARNQGDR